MNLQCLQFCQKLTCKWLFSQPDSALTIWVEWFCQYDKKKSDLGWFFSWSPQPPVRVVYSPAWLPIYLDYGGHNRLAYLLCFTVYSDIYSLFAHSSSTQMIEQNDCFAQHLLGVWCPQHSLAYSFLSLEFYSFTWSFYSFFEHTDDCTKWLQCTAFAAISTWPASFQAYCCFWGEWFF